MRILFIVHSFPPHNLAGVEVYAHALAEELKLRHEVSVMHRICNPRLPEYQLNLQNLDGLRVYTINNTFKYCYSFEGLYRNPRITEAAERILEEVRPDVVHIHHLIFLSADIVQKIKARGIPVIYTLHDYWFICPQWHFLKTDGSPCAGDNEADCLKCLSRWLAIKKGPKLIFNALRPFLPAVLLSRIKSLFVQGAGFSRANEAQKLLITQRKEYMQALCKEIDLFLSPSQFMRRRATEFGIPEKKNILVPFGIRREGFSIPRPLKSKLSFAFIGTILPAKGLHILIAAFNKIPDESAELHIYGKMQPYSGFESYPGYVKRLAQNKNIFFQGAFSHERLPEVLSGIDVLVVPSLWNENEPLVILEAFLHKIPVIASRIGGIPELIVDGKNGLLFTPGNSEELAKKINSLIEDRMILAYFKKNISEVKGIAEHVRELEALYCSVKPS